jgi:hypothetical protein
MSLRSGVNEKCVKILIVSHNALSLHANNGKTLYSLFKDWPAENIAQLYFQDEKPESEKFHNFFRVRDIDIFKVIIRIKKQSHCGDVIASEKYLGNLQVNRSKIKDIIKIILKDYMHIHIIVRDLIYATNIWRSNKLLDWISDFHPDAIFFLGGNSLFSFKVVLWLSEKYKIPLYMYLTDDYVINNKPVNLIQKWQHKALINCYKQTFDKATGLFVIGEMMAVEFEKYFSIKFHPIMNSIEFSNIVRPSFQRPSRNEIIIVYAGGLHLNRWKMIVEFGRLIKKCIKSLNKKVIIEIFSVQLPDVSIRTQLDAAPLSYKGELSGNNLKARLESADYLLHVESFEEKYRQLTKLSVSTKISEYLASGTCIIGYGPAEVASMRILSDNKIGITITDIDSDDEKIEKLKTIFSDSDKRNEFAQRGFDYAFNNFNAEKTRSYLKNILCAHQQVNAEKELV